MSPTPRGKQPSKQACERCKKPFQPVNRNARFCKRQPCARARKKDRWLAWREREEAKGVFKNQQNARQRSYRERTGYTRDYELRTKYGIILETWLAYLDAIEHKCEICGKSSEVLCVDHDHGTGKFRGALCRACNRSIGQLGDTVDHLRRALGYLEKIT